MACMVVVEFTAREISGPPIGALFEVVEIVAFDELGSGGDGIFHEKVLPLGAGDGDTHGQNVADR